MTSSGSTPSPRSEPPVRLWLLIAGEDHPKACTGRRLLKRRLVQPLSPDRPPRQAPILLDPHAETPLGPADLGLARTGGVLGIDCSWNRLAERGGYPDAARWLRHLPERRRLPWLVASNPQHYGRLGELNTAEALAAALLLFGESERAGRLLTAFPGGESFVRINHDRLVAYRTAPTEEALRAVEERLFA